MASPNPSSSHTYAGPYLDRTSHLRKDDAALHAALQDPCAKLVPVWRQRSLIGGAVAPAAVLLERRSWPDAVDAESVIFLGYFHSRPCFTVDIAAEEPPQWRESSRFEDLRMVGGLLPADEAGLLAYARAMVFWRNHHRYCGHCGSPTRSLSAGHVRQCSDPDCGFQQFPRLDPAIIVLVRHGERALLGRQASWPAGRYSAIAGFVEPGESLEDAVIREVREETGIAVTQARYHSSQPWPFPSSLMLGFMAEAGTTAIDCADHELEEARWFTRADIEAAQQSKAPVLPPSQSISYHLVEQWYNDGAARPLAEIMKDRNW